jgi:hypothetical protein
MRSVKIKEREDVETVAKVLTAGQGAVDARQRPSPGARLRRIRTINRATRDELKEAQSTAIAILRRELPGTRPYRSARPKA